MNERPWLRTALALLLTLTFVFEPLWAQQKPLEELSQHINELLYRPKYRATAWGIQVIDPERGEVLFAKNADKLFVPASNTKLFTTATAFERLGPDFRFKTNAYATGSVSENGIVDGDLVLESRGAFNFANMLHAAYSPSGILSDLAIQMAAKGIRQINGDLIADDAYFPHTHQPAVTRTATTKKVSRRGRRGRRVTKVKTVTVVRRAPVGSAPCPLALQDNVIRVAVTPGRGVGAPVDVFTLPETRFLTVENRATTGARRSKRALSVTKTGSNRIRISGRLPVSGAGFHATVPIDDPPRFTASLFKDTLAHYGIKVRGSVQSCYGRGSCGGDRSSWQRVAIHESMPLLDIIQVINKDSHNTLAELLLRALGTEIKGQGTIEAGLEVERAFLREIGVDSSQASLVDGSGLSRENLVTPQAVTQLLKHVYTRDYFASYFNSLAVNGVDGTLRRRMGQPELRERIHAKTGTLSNAITLSGYIATAGQKPLLFSIMANNLTISSHAARSTIDQICDILLSYWVSPVGMQTPNNLLSNGVYKTDPSGLSHTSAAPASGDIR